MTLILRTKRSTPPSSPKRRGAPKKMQMFRGEMMAVADIAAVLGRDRSSVGKKITRRGIEEWDDLDPFILSHPINSNLITHNGHTDNVAGWSRITGINYQTLRNRLKHGWSVARSLTEPVQIHRKRVKRS